MQNEFDLASKIHITRDFSHCVVCVLCVLLVWCCVQFDSYLFFFFSIAAGAVVVVGVAIAIVDVIVAPLCGARTDKIPATRCELRASSTLYI